MPPKKSDAASGENAIPTLTGGDVKMIDTILKNCSPLAKPTPMDWDIVAKQLDLKNVHSAKERFRQICKKYNWFQQTADSATLTSTPSTPAKGANSHVKSVRRHPMSPRSGDEADAKGTPAKKRKRNLKVNNATEVKIEPDLPGPYGNRLGDSDDDDNMSGLLNGEA
ncbi:hypothetical protein GGS26DRAFT_534916 [Hypomontagnella submonticulosa]|nr:hypothetical protein GGS26DRAFT_534916 [Hypomontagnella submonticulosa]